MFSVIGAYGVRNNIFDVYVCLTFGVIGWGMKRIGFPSAPLVLGVILGPLAERYFLTAMANWKEDWTVFFTRPISATILGLALVFVLWSLAPMLTPLGATAAVTLGLLLLAVLFAAAARKRLGGISRAYAKDQQ